MYKTGVMISFGISAAIILTLLLVQFGFWARYWLLSEQRPRNIFISKYLSELDDMDMGTYNVIVFMSAMFLALIGMAWPVVLPIGVLVVTMFMLRHYLSKERGNNA